MLGIIHDGIAPPRKYTLGYVAVVRRAPWCKGGDGEEGIPPSNIMFDRRVVRGNTYASKILAAERRPTCAAQKRSLKSDYFGESAPNGRGNLCREVAPQNEDGERAQSGHSDSTTSDAGEGRQDMEIQTGVELMEPIPLIQCSTQTALYVDRPLTPIRIPRKSGSDVATQIHPGELFDFEYEVEPIARSIVAKTMEASLVELRHEKECAAMRRRREEIAEERNVELTQLQRMEAIEKRRLEEKQRRLREETEREEEEQRKKQRVAARAFARKSLNAVVKDVFARLDSDGYFRDPVKEDIETDYYPYLLAKAEKAIHRRHQAHAALHSIVTEAHIRLDIKKTQQRETHLNHVQSERRRKNEETRVFNEQIQLYASALLTREAPDWPTPDAITAARSRLETSSETEVTDAEVIEGLLLEGLVTQACVIDAIHILSSSDNTLEASPFTPRGDTSAGRAREFDRKKRRRGRPAHLRSSFDTPLRDGNRDRLIGLLTKRAAVTLTYYLMETNINVHHWLLKYMKDHPIPSVTLRSTPGGCFMMMWQSGAWEDVSGETFLRQLLMEKIQSTKLPDEIRDPMFDCVVPIGVDPRSIAQRIMSIRSAIAKEFIEELQNITEENNDLYRETLSQSLLMSSSEDEEEEETAES